jgi:hypothetical protein
VLLLVAVVEEGVVPLVLLLVAGVEEGVVDVANNDDKRATVADFDSRTKSRNN